MKSKIQTSPLFRFSRHLPVGLLLGCAAFSLNLLLCSWVWLVPALKWVGGMLLAYAGFTSIEWAAEKSGLNDKLFGKDDSEDSNSDALDVYRKGLYDGYSMCQGSAGGLLLGTGDPALQRSAVLSPSAIETPGGGVGVLSDNSGALTDPSQLGGAIGGVDALSAAFPNSELRSAIEQSALGEYFAPDTDLMFELESGTSEAAVRSTFDLSALPRWAADMIDDIPEDQLAACFLRVAASADDRESLGLNDAQIALTLSEYFGGETYDRDSMLDKMIYCAYPAYDDMSQNAQELVAEQFDEVLALMDDADIAKLGAAVFINDVKA